MILFVAGDERLHFPMKLAASGIPKGLADLNIAAPPFPKAG